jgi:hypothetical protein
MSRDWDLGQEANPKPATGCSKTMRAWPMAKGGNLFQKLCGSPATEGGKATR